MKGERKLSLVKPPSAASPAPGEGARGEVRAGGVVPEIALPDGEPEVTEEELREAEGLRRALERGEDPFAEALRAAVSPVGLGEGDLDAILARAMGDVDAPPTALEEREAARLCAALEEHDAQREGRLAIGPGGRGAAREEGTGALAVALRAAWAPGPIGAARNDALVARALAGHAAEGAGSGAAGRPAAAARKADGAGGAGNEGAAPISLRRFRLGPRTFAAMTAVVAMAAGVMLLVTQLGQRGEAPAPASVAVAPASAGRAPRIVARSTADLFDATTPFPRTGGESARVDRIAGARAADLRANRFAAWGVR